MYEDTQADRVIDRLLAERREAEAKLQEGTTKTDAEVQEEARQTVPVGLRRDPDILRLIEKGGGQIPSDFLGDLVGMKLRKGL